MEPTPANAIFSRILAGAAAILVCAAVLIAIATSDGAGGSPRQELVASIADRVRIAAATASSAFWLVLAGTVVSRLRDGPDHTTRALLAASTTVVMVAAGAGMVAGVLDDSGSFFVPVAFGRISTAIGATQTVVCGALLWWIRSDHPAVEEPTEAEPEPVELEP